MADNDNPQGLTKNQLKKQRAAEKKAAKKAAAAKRQQEAESARKAKEEGDDVSKGKYGEKIIRSLSLGECARGERGFQGENTPKEGANKKFTQISELSSAEGKAEAETVTIRCRVQAKRSTGNLVFLTLRQQMHTIQAVVAKGETTSKLMCNFVAAVTRESIVDVVGVVKAAEPEIQGTTQSKVELHITEFWVRAPAIPKLPFGVDEASIKESEFVAQEAALAEIDAEIAATDDEKAIAELKAKKDDMSKYARVHLATRLDNRTIDLRVPAHLSTFRVQSWVQRLFREFLYSKNFTEVHTPKIIGGASEGGAEVFKIDYFGKDAFLAQSPQLYKQMALVCDFGPGVFEIAPVFRAEKSFTHRHLCEFMGMDLEMTIKEHYHEAVDMIDALFDHIFTGIYKNCTTELESVRAQYPFEDLKWTYPSLRLTWPEGIALLREAGVEIDDMEDIDTVNEKLLGKIVREKYDTDFYILDKFPLAIRPFYTMPDAEDPKFSNSYDFFIRGQEILSGAQRVHDPVLLAERAKAKGVPVEGIQAYVDCFGYGSEPHAGGGIGLERVVFLMLGLTDIRQSSMFPRDPHRTSP
jgi:aspartyl-tRNA synthetase